jgi:signal transduction histidine kinase
LQEEERRAISRELHDQLGQQATAINLDLKLLKNKIQSQAVEQLDRVISESEHLLKTIHDFSKRVRPVVLDDLGLHEALESYIWEFESRNHIASRFNSNIQDREYPDDVSENVFRLVQESLTNVTRHAEAKNVWIDIEHDDRQGGPVLNLTVSDDGVGMNLSDNGEEKSQRLGILGMQERVDLLGGQVDFQQRGDRGTQIAIRIPVRANYYLVDQEKSNE